MSVELQNTQTMFNNRTKEREQFLGLYNVHNYVLGQNINISMLP